MLEPGSYGVLLGKVVSANTKYGSQRPQWRPPRPESGALLDGLWMMEGLGGAVPAQDGGDQRVCANYRRVSLLSPQGVKEKPQIKEEQCRFHISWGTTDQLFMSAGFLEGAWERSLPIHMCFVEV